MPERRRARAFPAALAVAGLHLAVALALAGRALASAGLVVGGGDQPDTAGTVSFAWWTGFALLHGLDPFRATWTFYPVGQYPLAYFNLLDALVDAPLVHLLGPATGYDAMVVLALATTGMAGAALGRAVGLGWPAAALVGLGIESSTFVLNEVMEGRTTQAFLAFWLLALAALVRLFRGEGGRGLAVAAGLLSAAAGLVYWYYLAFLVLTAVPLALAECRRWDRATWGRVGLAAAAALAVLAAPVAVLAAHYAELPGMAREDLPADTWALARGEVGLHMAIRHADNVAWPFVRNTLIEGITGDQRLSLLLLALGAVGVAAGRGRRRWLAVALLGYVLALGPYPRTPDDAVHALPLPYLALYELVPVFQRFWWPGRFAVLAVTGLSVLAGAGAERLASALGRAGRPLPAVAGLLVVGEMALRSRLAPLPAAPPPAIDPGFYAHVDGPVVTVPPLPVDPTARQVLWAQVLHEQPLLYGLGAHLPAHRPPGFVEYVESRRLLSYLAQLGAGASPPVPVDPEDVQALLDDGFRWIVVEPEAFRPDRRVPLAAAFTRALSALFGPPDVKVGLAAAWRIRPIGGRVWIPAIRAGPGHPPRGRGRRR